MRAAVIVALLATACTTHKPIEYARELSNGDEVVAENHVGQTQEARVVKSPTSLELHSQIGVLPAQQVARITETSHGKGALQGAGLGFLIGAGIGAVVGYSDGDDHCDDDGGWCIFTFTAKEKAVLGGVVLGGTGAIVGLIVGAMVGSKTIYEDGTTTVTPIGPQGSTAGITVQF